MNKYQRPLKAIRTKCLECSGNQPKEVRLCTCIDCPLYLYRMGTNPARKGIGPKYLHLIQKSLIESREITKKEALNEQA